MPRGGYRAGAGRKPKLAKAMEEVVAQHIFEVYGSESKAWEAVIQAAQQNKDARLVFDILKYWTDRRYGKPRQEVSANVQTGARFGLGDGPHSDAVHPAFGIGDSPRTDAVHAAEVIQARPFNPAMA